VKLHTHTRPGAAGIHRAHIRDRTPLALTVCAAVICALLACAWWAASANAVVTHPKIGEFDGHETPAGSFGEAGSVAVSRTTGNVYVADIANNVIDVFSAAGKYESQITGAETPSGAFSFTAPAAIAIDNSVDVEDPSAGDVYVVDSGNAAIDKFSPGGAYLGQVEGFFTRGVFGLGVDGSGNLWVYDGGSDIFQFDSTGLLVSEFNTTGFGGHPPFAVDTEGNVYPSTAGGVERFNAHGELEGTVDPCAECQAAVATDFATNDVYFDKRTVVSEVDSSQHELGQFGETQLASGGEGGMSIAPTTGEIYVANATDKRVYVFAPAAGPRALTMPATAIHVSSAILHATVVPNEAETSYQFEYGTTTGYGESAPTVPDDIGSGTAPVEVESEIEGLRGSSTYHYRVVATNENGTFRSADRTFTTSPVPAIESVTATDVSGSSATLNAVVNPRGLEGTTYHFEWGDSIAYGNVAPLPDGAVSGPGVTQVLQAITGLAPGVLVHWRIVVTSTNGVVASGDHTFIYGIKEQSLPDGRKYEMVSPARKNGALLGDSFIVGGPATISADGSRVITTTLQCFAGSEGCTAIRGRSGTPVSFTRGTSGWLTAPLAASAAEFEGVSYWNYGATEGSVLFSAPNPSTHEDDFYVRDAAGAVRDVGPLTPPAEGAKGIEVAATYGDIGMDRVIWVSPTTKWPFDGTTGRHTIYEQPAGAAQPNLVAVSGGRGSTELLDVCGTAETTSPNAFSEDGSTYFMLLSPCAEGGTGRNAGVVIPAQELLARRGGEETVPISEPNSDPACTSAECLGNTGLGNEARFRGAAFAGASADGKHAFFMSTQQLTDQAEQDEESGDDASTSGCGSTTGSGCNLYEFECASCTSAAERKLIDVSAGDTSGGGPRVRGVVAASDDGSHVYFVSQGVLTSAPNTNGQSPTAGENNLYVYERDGTHPAGALAFIATYESTDSQEWLPVGHNPANVTPDGRYLVFMSRGRLTPDDTSESGALQVFRFDAETRQLVRISVGEGGYDDNGNRSSATPCQSDFCSEDDRVAPGGGVEQLSLQRLDPTMSDDGRFVFFQSPVALTLGALNDARIGVNAQGNPIYAQNVYEWHEGHVYLLSDGHDVSADTGQSSVCNVLSSVCLLGADSTGTNVFFTTADSLVPQDTDTELDYYDARVCTTAEPCVSAPGTAAECSGESCHGPASAPPVFGAPGSETFSGAGNTAPMPSVKKRVTKKAVKCKKGKKLSRGKCVKRQLKKKSKAKKSIHRKGSK
jgi:hypothetical protein